MQSFLSPLPGWGPPQRGLFVDCWGTLLELPEGGHVSRFEDAVFTPEAVDALFHVGQAGWRIYLIGNVPSVAFGRQDHAEWRGVQDDLIAHLKAHGILVQRDYSCTDHPEGVRQHSKDSVYLLPNTGAMYHASQADGIELRHSWVVGDATVEVAAGWRAGCHTAGVRTGLALRDGELHIEPEVVAPTLAAFLRGAAARTSIAG